MNLFYKDTCPLCGEALIPTVTSGYVIYDCPTQCHRYSHYYHTYSMDKEKSDLVEVFISDFYLSFSIVDVATSVFLLDPAPLSSFQYLFRIEGYFPVNWEHPEETSKRLHNLIPFM